MMLLFLVLDESMLGEFPKTSKSGGPPNHTHEPRNLVPLDSMLNNASERDSGIIVHNDVV